MISDLIASGREGPRRDFTVLMGETGVPKELCREFIDIVRSDVLRDFGRIASTDSCVNNVGIRVLIDRDSWHVSDDRDLSIVVCVYTEKKYVFL